VKITPLELADKSKKSANFSIREDGVTTSPELNGGKYSFSMA